MHFNMQINYKQAIGRQIHPELNQNKAKQLKLLFWRPNEVYLQMHYYSNISLH